MPNHVCPDAPPTPTAMRPWLNAEALSWNREATLFLEIFLIGEIGTLGAVVRNHLFRVAIRVIHPGRHVIWPGVFAVGVRGIFPAATGIQFFPWPLSASNHDAAASG